MKSPQDSSVARFAWIAVGAALITIALKAGAWLITDSVSLLSDALESLVNLVAAVVALVTLTFARKEPDEDHAYGHNKAEYFSSGFEGLLILVAAGSIVWTALPRLTDPVAIESVGIGVVVSIVASGVNFFAARSLLAASKQHESITLEADARHLMTDVVTTGGVVLGVLLIALTGWNILDPIFALIVALNIIWTGIQLLRRSMLGLLDTALPKHELALIEGVLENYRTSGHVDMHALRTRRAASRRFVSLHVIMPGDWTIEKGHSLTEGIERDIREALPYTTVFTHLEPDSDPTTWQDTELDRESDVTKSA